MKAVVYAASATVVVAALVGSAYFFRRLLLTTPPTALAVVPKVNIPTAAIIIPDGDGICRIHALDNATGQISDDGVVNCSNASNQNTETWLRAMGKDKYIEIGKSFRHEGSHGSH